MFNWKTRALSVRCASVFIHSICMKCCILKVVLCSLGCLILSWMSQICMNVVMCSNVFVYIVFIIRVICSVFISCCVSSCICNADSACILCAL